MIVRMVKWNLASCFHPPWLIVALLSMAGLAAAQQTAAAAPPTLPKGKVAVINTALQYNPEERFPSAQAMREALVAAGRKTGMDDPDMGTSGTTSDNNWA